MRKPSSLVEAVLYELCATHGHCLSPDDSQRLLDEHPDDAAAFVEAVLAAKGRDPWIVTEREREVLEGVVRDWLFDDGQGRGTSSGLPRLPE